MTLGDYLKQAVRHRWEPGRHDCCTFPAEWALTWGRGDPYAAWRGEYRSDAQAIRLINRAGGLLNLWQEGLASIGVYGVSKPRTGDVGVIRAVGDHLGPDDVGAIFLGKKWAWFTHRGVMFAPAEPLRAWGPR